MNVSFDEERLQRITRLMKLVYPKYQKLEKTIRQIGTRSDGLWRYRFVGDLLVCKHRELSPHEFPMFYTRVREERMTIFINLNGFIVGKVIYRPEDPLITMEKYHPEKIEEEITTMAKAFLRNHGLLTSILIEMLSCLYYWSMSKEKRKRANG